MNINSLIKIAISEAEKSEHKHRMGAVIYDKNIVISKGYNQPQRSVRSATFKFFKRNHSVHAEVDAIIKARRDLKGTSILVVRINKKGQLMNSKPCDFCMSYIDHVGIKVIQFWESLNESINSIGGS